MMADCCAPALLPTDLCPPMEQRALIVRVGPDHTTGLDELNIELQRGWRVAEVTPMGGTGLDDSGDAPTPFLAALVIIESSEQEANGPLTATAVKEVKLREEEKPQEVVREVVKEVMEPNGGLDG